MNETSSVKVDQPLSNRLGNLMVVCTVLILIMHLGEAGVNSMFDIRLFRNMTGLAVPLFFAMSGFWMARRTDKSGWYGTLLSRRFKTLFVPYILINTLFIPYMVVYHNVLGLGDWPGGTVRFNWYAIMRVYGLNLNLHPVCGTLWYVRCLLMFFVLSPIVVWVIRKSRLACAALLLGEILALAVLETFSLPQVWNCRFYSFFNLIGFFFFCAGISFAVWGEDAKKFIDRNRIPLAWIGLAVLLVLSSSSFPMRLPFSMIWYRVVGGLALFLLMPTGKPVTWLSSSCFAIYVFHEFIYRVYGIGVDRLGLSVFQTSQALSIVPLLLAVGLCVCFVQLVKRYAPKVGEYLLGGRC